MSVVLLNRFRALDRMEEDRKAILLNHLGFIQRAYRECCPFHDRCVDNLLEQTLVDHSKRSSSGLYSLFQIAGPVTGCNNVLISEIDSSETEDTSEIILLFQWLSVALQRWLPF